MRADTAHLFAIAPTRKRRPPTEVEMLHEHSPNLRAALGYAAARRPVFPLSPRSKEPAIARGFHSATTNPETIRRYWRVPDRNIGIATGALSGVWVLDIDGDEG